VCLRLCLFVALLDTLVTQRVGSGLLSPRTRAFLGEGPHPQVAGGDGDISTTAIRKGILFFTLGLLLARAESARVSVHAPPKTPKQQIKEEDAEVEGIPYSSSEEETTY
jgi:hypothetical protein